MIKPPIIRPAVKTPTIQKQEYYEIVMPDGTLMVHRDNHGNTKTNFDTEEEAERVLRRWQFAEETRVKELENYRRRITDQVLDI